MISKRHSLNIWSLYLACRFSPLRWSFPRSAAPRPFPFWPGSWPDSYEAVSSSQSSESSPTVHAPSPFAKESDSDSPTPLSSFHFWSPQSASEKLLPTSPFRDCPVPLLLLSLCRPCLSFNYIFISTSIVNSKLEEFSTINLSTSLSLIIAWPINKIETIQICNHIYQCSMI